MDWLKNKTVLQLISFLLVLLAFPVLTYGLQTEPAVTAVGLAMVIIGFLIPPATRFIGGGEEKKQEQE
ncbi:MAG: hypothetical protein C4521_06885 [Actinobacteria bacterium]|nr:MAG: hypothetical protein C4521_06885 [Actinomycetota bacterium]